MLTPNKGDNLPDGTMNQNFINTNRVLDILSIDNETLLYLVQSGNLKVAHEDFLTNTLYFDGEEVQDLLDFFNARAPQYDPDALENEDYDFNSYETLDSLEKY